MGYINGYSERVQIVIAPEKKVKRNVEKIGDLWEQFIVRETASLFVILICSHRTFDCICK